MERTFSQAREVVLSSLPPLKRFNLVLKLQDGERTRTDVTPFDSYGAAREALSSAEFGLACGLDWTGRRYFPGGLVYTLEGGRTCSLEIVAA
jgi:hypothetical protein